MPSETSSYYPPRASFASRGLALGGKWLRQAWRPRKPRTLAFGGVPPWRWLLVPGLLWRRLGKPWFGFWITVIWAAALMASLVLLNPPLANAAALLASGLHGLSAAAFIGEYFPHWSVLHRLWRTPLLVMLGILTFYGLGVRPAAGLFAQRLTARGQTVMIQPAGPVFGHEWRRGDGVAYQLPGGRGHWHHGNWIAWQDPGADVYFDRILAEPGDTLRFHKEFFEVNGQPFARLSPTMPVAGERTLPTDVYFIWPTDVALLAGNDPSAALLAAALVPKSNLLGKPWPRWFWRKQLPPPLKIWQAPHR